MARVNTENFVDLFAHIEIARLNGRHDQGNWGDLDFSALPLPERAQMMERLAGEEVVFDVDRGVPVGMGSCGTSFCAAGWGALLSGARLRWDRISDFEFTTTRTHEGTPVWEAASLWLGIPFEPGRSWEVYSRGFWSPANSVERLYEIAVEFLIGESLPAAGWRTHFPMTPAEGYEGLSATEAEGKFRAAVRERVGVLQAASPNRRRLVEHDVEYNPGDDIF